MAYGLGTGAPIDEQAIERVSKIRSPLRPWQSLSETCRLELIEQALLAANDRIDGYPLAL